jgi:hypothetical protein
MLITNQLFTGTWRTSTLINDAETNTINNDMDIDRNGKNSYARTSLQK